MTDDQLGAARLSAHRCSSSPASRSPASPRARRRSPASTRTSARSRAPSPSRTPSVTDDGPVALLRRPGRDRHREVHQRRRRRRAARAVHPRRRRGHLDLRGHQHRQRRADRRRGRRPARRRRHLPADHARRRRVDDLHGDRDRGRRPVHEPRRPPPASTDRRRAACATSTRRTTSAPQPGIHLEKTHQRRRRRRGARAVHPRRRPGRRGPTSSPTRGNATLTGDRGHRRSGRRRSRCPRDDARRRRGDELHRDRHAARRPVREHRHGHRHRTGRHRRHRRPIPRTTSARVSEIDVEKFTNGEDADDPPGPTIPVGGPVTWTYVVTNPGNVPIRDVTVVDDKGVVPRSPAATPTATANSTPARPGPTRPTGTAGPGQYENTATVTGLDVLENPLSDSDPSHYHTEPAPPSPSPPAAAAGPAATQGGHAQARARRQHRAVPPAREQRRERHRSTRHGL